MFGRNGSLVRRGFQNQDGVPRQGGRERNFERRRIASFDFFSLSFLLNSGRIVPNRGNENGRMSENECRDSAILTEFI